MRTIPNIMYGDRMSSRAIRADLDKHSAHMFSFIKRNLNVRSDAEVVRVLIKEGFDRRSKVPMAQKGQKLTPEEEDKLYSWAITTNLKGAEEKDIRSMLLGNKHVWFWITKKLPDAVAYVLELKKN